VSLRSEYENDLSGPSRPPAAPWKLDRRCGRSVQLAMQTLRNDRAGTGRATDCELHTRGPPNLLCKGCRRSFRLGPCKNAEDTLLGIGTFAREMLQSRIGGGYEGSYLLPYKAEDGVTCSSETSAGFYRTMHVASADCRCRPMQECRFHIAEVQDKSFARTVPG
jgi:hypothetical protein